MNIVLKKLTFWSKLRMSQNVLPRPGPSQQRDKCILGFNHNNSNFNLNSLMARKRVLSFTAVKGESK